MNRMFQALAPAIALLFIAGCSSLQNTFATPPFEKTEEVVQPEVEAPAPEVVTPQESDVANAPPENTGRLGQTIASLGDPTQPGFWLKTPLVTAETQGRIEGADGRSVQVRLLPLSGQPGAGSEISLSAMRGLGLSLTDLASLTVFAGGA